MKTTAYVVAVTLIVIGFGIYGQVENWWDVKGFFDPKPEEEKALGVVGDLRSLAFSTNNQGISNDHIHIFTLICDDGTVLNLGIDYDNFAFKNGDRIEVFYFKKFEKGIGVPDNYKARWYPLKNYRLTKEPTTIPAEK
jgi:hypothetical protein